MNIRLNILFLFLILLSVSAHAIMTTQFNISATVVKKVARVEMTTQLIMPTVLADHSTFPIYSSNAADFPSGTHGQDAICKISGLANTLVTLILPPSMTITNAGSVITVYLGTNSTTCTTDNSQGGSGECYFNVRGKILSGTFVPGNYIGTSTNVTAVYF